MFIPTSQLSQAKTRMNVCSQTVIKDKQIAAVLAPVIAIAVLLRTVWWMWASPGIVSGMPSGSPTGGRTTRHVADDPRALAHIASARTAAALPVKTSMMPALALVDVVDPIGGPGGGGG